MNTYRTRPPENKRLIARDRVLLYTRGMDMDPEDGVGLALESLRRAGRDAEPGKVMEELFALLRENRSPLTVSGAGSAPLPSVPAMNRRTVLPNAMEPLSLTAAIAKLFRALSGRLLKKHGARDHG